MALGVREELVGCEKSGLDGLHLLSLGIGWLCCKGQSPQGQQALELQKIKGMINTLLIIVGGQKQASLSPFHSHGRCWGTLLHSELEISDLSQLLQVLSADTS